jgi:hypothetical protein
MKIVFFGESPADQAALRVFTEGILGEPPELVDMSLEGHGVTGVLKALSGVFLGVYYNSDAEGLVVAVDGDDTDMHDSDHDKLAEGREGCRLCQVRKIITQARKHLRAKPGRPGLKVAIGVAVPAIEAWYLVGKEHQVGEAAWRAGVAANRPPFTRSKLKELAYGNTRPSLELEMECAVREAQRIIGDIRAIETAFPIGFGLMASDIRSWKSE